MTPPDWQTVIKTVADWMMAIKITVSDSVSVT